MAKRLSRNARTWALEEIQKQLSRGIIEEADPVLEWTSPIVIAPKPNNKFRLCIDYRELNKYTRTEIYPQRRIEDVLIDLGNKQWISKFDAKCGYWQVPLKDIESRNYTTMAFSGGRYRWT
eukprot:GHVP01012617.1.p1 GENE.GHVP01012617.1~~GHVP01012617.1.p1  ORF type:complete len:121 (+),score=17.78 GHVP01012617.1:241-603(+)